MRKFPEMKTTSCIEERCETVTRSHNEINIKKGRGGGGVEESFAGEIE